MQNRNLITGSLLGAVIIATGTYVLRPDSSAPAQTPDSAKQAAGVFDRLTSRFRGHAEPLPQWQDPSVIVINGYKVPPVPDPKINNATLLGVDTDKNGIRDDIDRLIAEKIHNPEWYVNAQNQMRAMEFAMQNPSPQNIEAFSKILACTPGATSAVVTQLMFLDQIEQKMINTGVRGSAYAKAFAGREGYMCNHYK